MYLPSLPIKRGGFFFRLIPFFEVIKVDKTIGVMIYLAYETGLYTTFNQKDTNNDASTLRSKRRSYPAVLAALFNRRQSLRCFYRTVYFSNSFFRHIPASCRKGTIARKLRPPESQYNNFGNNTYLGNNLRNNRSSRRKPKYLSIFLASQNF